MATTRTITTPIPLVSPEAIAMGQALPSIGGSVPADFNQLNQNANGIDHAGWVASQGMAQNIGGQIHPIVGDYGLQYFPISNETVSFPFQMPRPFTKYSFIIYTRFDIDPTHKITAWIERDIFGTLNQTIVPLANYGTTVHPEMFTGTLSAPIQAFSSGCEDAILHIQITRDPLPFVTNSGSNLYWTGLLAFSLKLFK